MGRKQAYTAELSIIECCNCGMDFAITGAFEERKRRDHKTFYCPAGHQQHFPQLSDIERAKEAQEKAEGIAEAERTRHNMTKGKLAHTEARRRGEKAAKTKLKKWGVCPCCPRSFANVARHVQNQHPEYMEEKKDA